MDRLFNDQESNKHSIRRALSDLRCGVPIVLGDLNSKYLVASAETLTEAQFNRLNDRFKGQGLLVTAVWRGKDGGDGETEKEPEAAEKRVGHIALMSQAMPATFQELQITCGILGAQCLSKHMINQLSHPSWVASPPRGLAITEDGAPKCTHNTVTSSTAASNTVDLCNTIPRSTVFASPLGGEATQEGGEFSIYDWSNS